MKKFLIILMVLACASVVFGDTLTYGPDYYRKNLRTILSGSTTSDPLYLFINEVDGTLAGTTSVPALYFEPTATGSAPTAVEGLMFYDTTTGTVKYRNNASAWISLTGLAAGAAGTLDDSYNSGYSIDVDGSPVTLTVSDNDNNVALAITQNDATNNVDGMSITMASSNTGDALYINGVTGSTDIRGDTWNIANTSILTLKNGDAIDNSTTDDIFQFTSNDKEDFSIDLSGTNIIGFSSDTSAITLEFNALDRLTGIEDITFDAEAANITLTGDANTEDLTISQAGTVDCSLILSSAGSITDALSLITTDAVGVIKISSSDILDVDAVDHMNFDISGASSDFRVDSAAGSVYLEGAEAVGNAIVIDASNGAGGIDMDCGSGGFDLTVTAGDLTLQNTTAKDIVLNATAGRVLITGTESAADAIILTANGTNGEIALVAAVGGVDIDGVLGAVTINTTKNSGNAIHIEENGGTSAGINIFANQGIGASATTEHDASIQLHSDDGGIGLYTTGNVADAVRIETNGGVDEFITINNLQGTGADAITIKANAAAGNVNIQSVLGSILIKAEENAVDAILIQVDGVNATTMRLIASTGTSVAENAAAITINAAAGGINIQSDANLDDAIVIRVDGGTTSEMTITNDQGNTTDSIDIVSAAGGILITAAKPVRITNAFELDVVVIADTSPYTVLANNSGQVHMVPDFGQDTTFNLPAEADGLHYKFIYVGNAADTSDWIITSGDNTEQFVGGVVQHDEDGELTIAYYSNNTTNSKLGVLTPESGTVIEMWYDLATTSWYITGTVISKTATGVTFSDT